MIRIHAHLKQADHDYNPEWDYEIDEAVDATVSKAVDAACKVIKTNLIPQVDIFSDFEVHFVTGIEELGKYANGTYSRPVVLLSAANIMDAEAEYGIDAYTIVQQTILHELAHAIQEASEQEMDEDDAEAFIQKYFKEAQTIPLGECYSYAIQFINKLGPEDSEDAMVVHGKVYDKWKDTWNDHAWVEYEGHAYDWQTSHREPLTIEQFYEIYTPEDVKQYFAETAMINALRSGHYGPWGKTAREYHGSSGAGVLLHAQDTGRYLVALRSEDVMESGTWGIIGGKIDDDEDPEQAARRELIEETGYSGPIDLKLIHVFEEEGFTYHNFLGTIPEEEDFEVNWETDEFLWVSRNELNSVRPLHYGLEELLGHI